MSAPPLPEVFGNYVLGDFVEVVAPPAINWLPQTTGWLWLGAGLLIVMLRYSYKRLRNWYRNRYRREAVVRLQRLADTHDHSTFLLELNRLLKLTALATFSRERVARLHGAQWVEFLNGQCSVAPFSSAHSQLLAVGIYSDMTLDQNTRQQLLGASRTWINEHMSASHV